MPFHLFFCSTWRVLSWTGTVLFVWTYSLIVWNTAGRQTLCESMIPQLDQYKPPKKIKSNEIWTDRNSRSSSSCSLKAFMHIPFVFSRWWWWGGEWGRALAILLWLHHALPDSFLESSLRFCPSHWVLERLGLLLCLHFPHWRPDSCDWGPGLSFRLHHRSQRLGHRCGVRGSRHLCSRWVSMLSISSYGGRVLCFLWVFAHTVEAAARGDLCNLCCCLCCQRNPLQSSCLGH